MFESLKSLYDIKKHKDGWYDLDWLGELDHGWHTTWQGEIQLRRYRARKKYVKRDSNQYYQGLDRSQAIAESSC